MITDNEGEILGAAFTQHGGRVSLPARRCPLFVMREAFAGAATPLFRADRPRPVHGMRPGRMGILTDGRTRCPPS